MPCFIRREMSRTEGKEIVTGQHMKKDDENLRITSLFFLLNIPFPHVFSRLCVSRLFDKKTPAKSRSTTTTTTTTTKKKCVSVCASSLYSFCCASRKLVTV